MPLQMSREKTVARAAAQSKRSSGKLSHIARCHLPCLTRRQTVHSDNEDDEMGNNEITAQQQQPQQPQQLLSDDLHLLQYQRLMDSSHETRSDAPVYI